MNFVPSAKVTENVSEESWPIKLITIWSMMKLFGKETMNKLFI